MRGLVEDGVMSRVGKKPVVLPDKVKARLMDSTLHFEGPLGKTELRLSPEVVVEVDQKQIVVKRKEETGDARRIQGVMRALIQNNVTGLSEGFKKVLDIQGIGYRAEVKGEDLTMTLGFSHPVVFSIPKGIKIAVEKQTRLTISGSMRDQVGQVAASVRALRPPEPYKGKGIKYENEVIQRKVGKAAAAGGGGGGAK